jgi:hypothetical protein
MHQFTTRMAVASLIDYYVQLTEHQNMSSLADWGARVPCVTLV